MIALAVFRTPRISPERDSVGTDLLAVSNGQHAMLTFEDDDPVGMRGRDRCNGKPRVAANRYSNAYDN